MSLPVQMEIFLALGKDNQRRVSSPKFRLLPQREALIGSFTATGNLITQAFLFTLAAYFFIG